MGMEFVILEELKLFQNSTLDVRLFFFAISINLLFGIMMTLRQS